jgi:CofD-related protein of GAK system
MRIRLTRDFEIPDRYKLELYRRAPELGPRILFFSGGTALRKTSNALINYTHNSIHLMTPFDSGGSSAILRKAFGMPAVGDIRNRLMALADQSVKGSPEIFQIFAYRLPTQVDQAVLREELQTMADGTHSMVESIPDPMRKIIRTHFQQFLEVMPDDFDLRGASIGNLVLAAGYLSNRNRLDPVIYIFSKLAQVCGSVHPTVNEDLHLAVKLKNGTVIVGQHNITGKEVPPLTSPVRDIWLTDSLESEMSVRTEVSNKIIKRIAEADLICYPLGSFYSSIIANLLPYGVGKAVAANSCPKVFVPNTGYDPEADGITVTEQVRLIKEHLHRSGAPHNSEILGHVIVDSTYGDYFGGINKRELKELGVTVIDCPLVTEQSKPYLDENRLSEVLLSLT